MKVSRENCPVKPLIGKMKREKIVLKHKLQRRESVWSNPNKSLLIDSLLRGYIVPPVYTISEDGVQYVIDGVQRLSTLKGFYNDEFAISKKAEPVIIEGAEYNIAGMKFSKLDQVVKDELDSSAITVYEITKYKMCIRDRALCVSKRIEFFLWRVVILLSYFSAKIVKL